MNDASHTTSVPSERLFSVAGDIIAEHRSRLLLTMEKNWYFWSTMSHLICKTVVLNIPLDLCLFSIAIKRNILNILLTQTQVLASKTEKMPWPWSWPPSLSRGLINTERLPKLIPTADTWSRVIYNPISIIWHCQFHTCISMDCWCSSWCSR